MFQSIANGLTYQILGLSPNSQAGHLINFFLYDSIKIIFMLFSMITLIGILRSYVSQEKICKWIENKPAWMGHVMASLFGVLTPFCSCSSIPLFLSFLKAGIPLGITLSFLITSPLVNEYLLVLMTGFFGLKIAILYTISGVLIGVLAGMLLSHMKLEKYLVADLMSSHAKDSEQKEFLNFLDRIRFGLQESWNMTRKVGGWIILGVAVGTYIHNFVPQETIQILIGQSGFLTVPLAVFIGIPLYGSCAAIVPVAMVLFEKGVPLGTALAFMMAVSGLSFPEAIILRRAMKTKLILLFFGIVALGIMVTGFLFNLIS